MSDAYDEARAADVAEVPIEVQPQMSEKGRKRLLYTGLGCLALYGIFMATVLILSYNTQKNIIQVQENQAAGAERSFVIIGKIDCSNEGQDEFNKQLAALLGSLVNRDSPAVADQVAAIQKLSEETAQQCAAIDASNTPPEPGSGEGTSTTTTVDGGELPG